MQLLEKAVNRYRSGGLRLLLNEIWRYAFDKMEAHSPDVIRRVVVQLYWLPYGMILYNDGSIHKLKHIWDEESFYFPQLKHHRRYRSRSLKRKGELYYEFEEIRLESGDTVVDVGAFIGETTITASELASEVHAIEPSHTSFYCLRQNVADLENVSTSNDAVWNESADIEFQLGEDASDNSIIDPDYGDATGSDTVVADTLNSICMREGITEIDLLKVDAEGVEPEVLQGLGDLPIRKLAVNCDPERYGETTKVDVSTILENRGYRVVEGDDVYNTILYGEHMQSDDFDTHE